MSFCIAIKLLSEERENKDMLWKAWDLKVKRDCNEEIREEKGSRVDRLAS